MSEPPAKKQKFQYKKKFYQPNRKQYLEAGQKGFLATCNFNEKDCVRECYNLLNQCANELYGPEEDDFKEESLNQDPVKDATDEEQPPNEDIADELQKQISASQQKKPSNKRRFQAVDTGATNCVFIKTTLDDPVRIGEHIVKDIAQSRKQKTRYLLRLVPIDAVCKANDKDIVNTAGQLCDKYFLKEPTTFSIVFNKRFNNDLSRDQLICELADLIHAKNIKNKVDLKHAKKSLIVEVIKGLCCLTVVENYMEMKKYNLIELAKANPEYIKSNKDDKIENVEPLLDPKGDVNERKEDGDKCNDITDNNTNLT